MNLPPLRVCVTGAAGQIAYSLLPHICLGRTFGPDRRVILHLMDIDRAQTVRLLLNSLTSSLPPPRFDSRCIPSRLPCLQARCPCPHAANASPSAPTEVLPCPFSLGLHRSLPLPLRCDCLTVVVANLPHSCIQNSPSHLDSTSAELTAPPGFPAACALPRGPRVVSLRFRKTVTP